LQKFELILWWFSWDLVGIQWGFRGRWPRSFSLVCHSNNCWEISIVNGV
jgi:hypothetical protein